MPGGRRVRGTVHVTVRVRRLTVALVGVGWYPKSLSRPLQWWTAEPEGGDAVLRTYDVLLIVDSRLTDEEVAQLGVRLQEVLAGLGGEVLSSEDWGRRRLVFELRKQREGHYLLLQVRATPAVMREYERQLKLNESVLRYLTTRVVEGRRKLSPSSAAPAEPTGAAAPATSEVG
jgi:small subunit ribosomal protein S6